MKRKLFSGFLLAVVMMMLLTACGMGTNSHAGEVSIDNFTATVKHFKYSTDDYEINETDGEDGIIRWGGLVGDNDLYVGVWECDSEETAQNKIDTFLGFFEDYEFQFGTTDGCNAIAVFAGEGGETRAQEIVDYLGLTNN